MSFHIKIIIFTKDLCKRKPLIVKNVQIDKNDSVWRQALFGIETFCKTLELGMWLGLSLVIELGIDAFTNTNCLKWVAPKYLRHMIHGWVINLQLAFTLMQFPLITHISKLKR